MKNTLTKTGVLIVLTTITGAVTAAAQEPATGVLRAKVVGNDGNSLPDEEIVKYRMPGRSYTFKFDRELQ